LRSAEGDAHDEPIVNEAAANVSSPVARRRCCALAVATLAWACTPSEDHSELAAAHSHADHGHASIPEHAAHAHDARSPARSTADAIALVDIDGIDRGTLAAPARGRWMGLFFTRTDCPIANRYAPEIKRVCADYAAAGLECLLVYVDGHLTAGDVREHATAFGYALPAILDGEHALVAQAGATITPEVAVFARGGTLEYRGRIDDLYVELGRPRRAPTERDLRDALDDLVAGRTVRRPQTQATGCYIE
jgi:hypothetical protein